MYSSSVMQLVQNYQSQIFAKLKSISYRQNNSEIKNKQTYSFQLESLSSIKSYIQSKLISNQKFNYLQSQAINKRLQQICLQIDTKLNFKLLKNLNQLWKHPNDPIIDINKLNKYCYDKYRFELTTEKQKYIKLSPYYRGKRRYDKYKTLEQNNSISIRYNGKDIGIIKNVIVIPRLRMKQGSGEQLIEYIQILESYSQKLQNN